jgi:two-component system chemotaxis response regulator CheB
MGASAGSAVLGQILGVVSSTGGPAALQTVLSGLSPTFTAPIVIVQHLPPGFAKSLASNLTRRTGRTVIVAENGARLESGSTMIAPGDTHLEVHGGTDGLYCKLADGPKENGCRPAGDRMLRSAARATRGRMVGVCLTGMGNDGAAGMLELHRVGGHVIVQDEASSVVWGMPAAVLDAGVPAVVLPLDRIASSLNRKSNRKAA